MCEIIFRNSLDSHLFVRYLNHQSDTKNKTTMKNASTVVLLNEFEAMVLHKHYKEMAKKYKRLGISSLPEKYLERADQWLNKAIEIAKENEENSRY